MSTTITPIAAADDAECELLERLVSHPALRRIATSSDEDLLELLLQRRFISHIFSTVYDLGIDALSGPEAVRLARQIVREEYPDGSGDTPSHREDLVADLVALGATRSQILASRPTAATLATLTDTLALMAEIGTDEDDLRVLAMLRFWGEVVVSVEYGEFWKRIRGRFAAPGASGPASRFYLAHYSHDGRDPLASATDASATHSGRLGAQIRPLLARPGALDAFLDVERRVLGPRLRFYDQFVAAAGTAEAELAAASGGGER